MIISKEWLQCCLAALFSYVFSSMNLSGHHVSVWHYQWEVLWQHQELDTEYRRGKILYWCVCILESILGIDRLQRALESAQLWAHFVADSFPVCSLCQTFLPQHASADVERMVLGNKCDVNDKRQVSKDRGEKVINLIMHAVRTWFKKYTRISLCWCWHWLCLFSPPVSWRWSTVSNSWRPVQRRTSTWRTWVPSFSAIISL